MRIGVLATLVFGALIGYPIASFAGLAPDADGDTVPDVLDKCVLDSRNVASSCDHDSDGYGNPCDPDFDNSLSVSSGDFTVFFVPAFKGLDPSPWPQGMDMDCSGSVSSGDFSGFFVPKFKGGLGGAVPGPSGLGCAGTVPCN